MRLRRAHVGVLPALVLAGAALPATAATAQHASGGWNSDCALGRA